MAANNAAAAAAAGPRSLIRQRAGEPFVSEHISEPIQQLLTSVNPNAEWVQLKLEQTTTTTTTATTRTTTTTTSGEQHHQQQLHPTPLGSSPRLLSHFTWRYTFLISIALGLWLVYLLLPKGFRFHYCRAYRRRYAKSKQKVDWLHAIHNFNVVDGKQQSLNDESYYSSVPSDRGIAQRRRPAPSLPSSPDEPSSRAAEYQEGSAITGMSSQQDKYNTGQISVGSSQWRTSPRRSAAGSHSPMGSSYLSRSPRESPSSPVKKKTHTPPPQPSPPSPNHPAISRTPPKEIIDETMKRLRSRGIRLMAHGIQSEPKRVWIRIDEETTSIAWQTEFPRRVPNSSGEVSLVLMRGSLHKIALPNVLYVDVGKKTTALKKAPNNHVADNLCFSLLTQNGSLDLQANSALERDALVSSFSMLLDAVHTEDWRRLYEESPAPSQVSSVSVSNAATTTTSDVIRSDVVII